MLEKEILNALIDRYERSSNFINGVRGRKIALESSKISRYQGSSHEDKQRVHLVVKTLANKNLVAYEWERFEEENILKRVILDCNHLEEAYKFLKRIPLIVQIEGAYGELCLLESDEVWIQRYCEDMKHTLVEEKRFHKLLPKEDETRALLIKTLSHLDKLEDTTERLFSARVLGDSKVFERKIRSRLLTVMKAYSNEFLEDEMRLERIGLHRNQNEVLIKGDIWIKIKGNRIDLNRFPWGTSLNTRTIQNIESIRTDSQRIVTIENKASYYDYIANSDEQEVVIYLAGFFGKSMKILLRKIVEENSKLRFLHWGDIDLGGMMIYRELHQIIGENIQPHMMDVETLIKYESDTMIMNEAYVKKLEAFDAAYEGSPFKEVTSYMLKKKIVLEQENVHSHLVE
jgi:hypothetical protein